MDARQKARAIRDATKKLYTGTPLTVREVGEAAGLEPDAEMVEALLHAEAEGMVKRINWPDRDGVSRPMLVPGDALPWLEDRRRVVYRKEIGLTG